MLNYNHPDYVPMYWCANLEAPSDIRRTHERRRRKALFAHDRYVQFGVDYWASDEVFTRYIRVLERFSKKAIEVGKVRRDLQYMRVTYGH